MSARGTPDDTHMSNTYERFEAWVTNHNCHTIMTARTTQSIRTTCEQYKRTIRGMSDKPQLLSHHECTRDPRRTPHEHYMQKNRCMSDKFSHPMFPLSPCHMGDARTDYHPLSLPPSHRPHHKHWFSIPHASRRLHLVISDTP